jgi:hypothetical protein
MTYEIPEHLPQPTGYDTDGSPYWDFDGNRWTNREWMVPLERLAEYIVHQPPVEPEPVVVPVPEFVGPAQIRLVLASQGITEAVITQMIGALPEDQRGNARILWDHSSQFYRNNPFVVQVGAAMGLTSDQIDDMFRVAITL